MHNADILAYAGLRGDGRKIDELRKIRHKISVFPSADGSSYFESGLNKVMVIVTGPMEPRRQNDQMSDKGFISIHLATAPFSGNDHRKRRLNDKRSIEVESILRQTFEGAVILDLYAKSEINVTIHVLESDGSIICTMINAITLALMDAGISMTDMVTASSVGQVRGKYCVDVNQVEQNSGGAYIPLAIKPRNEEVIFLQLNSRLSANNLREAMEVAIEGCRKIKMYMDGALKSYMNEALTQSSSL